MRSAGSDSVFSTRNGTPLSQRHVQRSALHSAAAAAAGVRVDRARLRFHDLQNTFASHIIIDLGLDVVQVSPILGHASPSTTLSIYAHMFDEARHAADIRARMARSALAGLLQNDEDDHSVSTLPAAVGVSAGPPSGPASAPRSSWQLDQNLTKRGQARGKALTAAAEKALLCRQFVMELARLEPATSWVRYRRLPWIQALLAISA